MKKFLCIAALLAFSLLTGCYDEDGTPLSTNPPETTTEATTALTTDSTTESTTELTSTSTTETSAVSTTAESTALTTASTAATTTASTARPSTKPSTDAPTTAPTTAATTLSTTPVTTAETKAPATTVPDDDTPDPGENDLPIIPADPAPDVSTSSPAPRQTTAAADNGGFSFPIIPLD